MKKLEKIEFIIKQDILIKDFIKNNIGKKFYRYLKRTNCEFYLDTELAYNYTLALCNQKLCIVYEKEEFQCNIKDLVLYEDDYLMVIDKPTNINTIPTSRNDNSSLYNLIVGSTNNTIHFINRLDKETSGLMLVCKDKFVANKLSKDIHNNIHRYYITECMGILKNIKSIETFIKKSDDSIKREVSVDGLYSKTDITHITNIDNNSILKIKLHTGRTHQIRVHLSYLNHPIIGDGLYGDKLNIMHLHSSKLVFIHPITKQILSFISLPKFIRGDDLLKQIENSLNM